MEEYGELLEEFNPEKNMLYDSFVTYFNNPVMTKTKNTTENSIYMVKTMCMLSTKCRYLVAIIPLDKKPIGYKIKLSNLNWVSFQTRTLIGNFSNVGSVDYLPEKKGNLMSGIERISKNEKSSLYFCDNFPISITLINDDNINEYQSKGTIISALETYNTVIMLK